MEKYEIKISCSNCGYTGIDEKEKGHAISPFSKTCPNCGCNTLKESQNIKIRSTIGNCGYYMSDY